MGIIYSHNSKSYEKVGIINEGSILDIQVFGHLSVPHQTWLVEQNQVDGVEVEAYLLVDAREVGADGISLWLFFQDRHGCDQRLNGGEFIHLREVVLAQIGVVVFYDAFGG